MRAARAGTAARSLRNRARGKVPKSLARENVVSGLLQWLTALAAGMGILVWLLHPPTIRPVVSVPGMDGRSKALQGKEQGVKIGAFFQRYAGTPSAIPGAWPRFRGANLDAISPEPTRLLDTFGTNGPPRLWSLSLGEGHGGAAVWNGRVFLLDYDEKKRADTLRCFSLDDGREIWRRWYDVPVKRNHGMSRTVPAVTDRHVVTIGPKCHTMCVRPDSGDLLWGLDMVATYGTKIPGWYAGQCPFVDDGLAILAPAGSNTLMVAVDCETGQPVWSTPNPRKWNMSHATVMPMTLAGRRMYVYAAVGGVAGVAADGPNRGAVLWETAAFSPSVVASSPLVLPDGRIFLTAGYGAGGAMLKIAEQGGKFTVTLLSKHKPRDGLSCEQQTPVLLDGHLFGIMPKDAGSLRDQMTCWTPEGKLVWTSGKDGRFGIGPWMVADGKFLILDDDGVMTMARATPAGYAPLARARVLPGVDSWAPPALVAGRLLIRDSHTMVCLDMRAANR
jgi:outer membrane protein assembly factor BamB